MLAADGEVTFEQMKRPEPDISSGWAKIQGTCQLALSRKIEYAWVDTCCIDKRSSAELSESINSMFSWYRQAKICFVYLVDYHLDRPSVEYLRRCRWFWRGWTLQVYDEPGILFTWLSRAPYFFSSFFKIHITRIVLS